MSDKKISDLNPAAILSPDAVVPVAQVDPMDGILKTFGITADKFSHGFYTFPNDTMFPVTTTDIGKLAMNDGSGTAKVYKVAPAAPAVLGSWTIQINPANAGGLDLDTFNSSNSSYINIKKYSGGSYSENRNGWTGGTVPATSVELTQLKTVIDGFISAHSLTLSTALSGDTLTITETSYTGFIITMGNTSNGIFTVVQKSLPPLIEAPTAFPLGKIVGLKGTDVLISSQYVETYTLDAAVTIDYSTVNTVNYASYDLSNPTAITNLAKLLVVPSDAGKVKLFDMSQYTVDQSLLYAMRDQLLGLVLKINGTEVTVLHFNVLGPILNTVLKTIFANSN